MRWAWILVFIGIAVANPKTCNIAEFEYQVRTIHNPTERHQFAIDWITKAQCSNEQIVWLWNNSPDLMGTADTPRWRYLLTLASERK